MLNALLILQIFHVLFLALHDWVPLGNLNDLKAARAANPGVKLLAGTLISTLPFALDSLPAFSMPAEDFRTGFIYICGSATRFFLWANWKRGGFHTSLVPNPSGHRATKPCLAARTVFFPHAMGFCPTRCTLFCI